MTSLRLDPDLAGPDDVCPGCGYLILGGHPLTCPFYDLLDAIAMELWMDELWRQCRNDCVAEEETRAFLMRIAKRLHPEYGLEEQQAWVERGMNDASKRKCGED